jgi:hypothetical protein
MNAQQAKTAMEQILKTETQKQGASNARAEWLQNFRKATSSPAGLGAIAVPPCQT